MTEFSNFSLPQKRSAFRYCADLRVLIYQDYMNEELLRRYAKFENLKVDRFIQQMKPVDMAIFDKRSAHRRDSIDAALVKHGWALNASLSPDLPPKGKVVSLPNPLDVFRKHFESTMINIDFRSFLSSHPTLTGVIVASMTDYHHQLRCYHE